VGAGGVQVSPDASPGPTKYRISTVLTALRSVAIGTKRTYRHDLLLVRFRGEADIHDRLAWTASVANDPKATSGALIKAWQVVKSFRYLLTDPYELNILLHLRRLAKRIQFNQNAIFEPRGP
jgi:hypothetical protein